MSYRNYGSWSKGDLNQNYSSGTKASDPSPTAKKYESSYSSRSKPEPPAPKENVRSPSNLDKNTGANRYNSTSTSNLRNTYSPAAYTRDKPGTREKDSTITAISNRYANFSIDDKPDKQSVLSKYMNAKSNEKKSDALNTTSYSRSGTNSSARPRSRDHSPVDKNLYGYGRNISSRSHDDNHDEVSSKSKLSSVIKDKMNSERDKDIPNKTSKPSYTTPAYPSYKLYTRSNTYTRPLVKEEPKVEPVSAIRYNASTNRFGSVPYSRSSLIEKPSLYVPHISSSPSTVSSCSSPKSTNEFNFNTTPIKDEVKIENKECQNGNDMSKDDEEESDSEEESSESEDYSMITLDVVTRGTSPTAPCSSIYMRTRRADMAKTIEKTVTRSKKKVEMVDKEMQSDRLDDSTRTSRYASTSRTAASPWTSYMDSRYTSTVSSGRYSSGLSGSRYSNYSSSRDTSSNSYPADKTPAQEDESSSKKAESAIPIINNSQDSARSRTPTRSFSEQIYEMPVKTSSLEMFSQISQQSEPIKELVKTSPPRSIPVKEKSKSKSPPLSLPKSSGKQSSPESCCNLPPQVPKTDPPPLTKSSSSIHSLNKAVKSTGKKIIKKVRSKDGETKKRLVKRSVSISSGDSESSVQCGDTDNDCMENGDIKKIPSLKKVKSGILKTKSSSELKTDSPSKSSTSSSSDSNRNSKSRSRTSLSLTSSSTETNSAPTSESEDDVVHESKTINIQGKPGDSSRTSVLASSADEVSLSLDKPLKPPSSPNSLKNDSQPRTEEAKSFLMRALAPVTCLFKMRSQESTGDKGHWLDSTGESDNQNTLNVVSIETDTESKSLNNKPHKIRHIESGEKAWWMESNSDKKSSENKLKKSKSTTKSKSFEPVESNIAENCNGYQLKIIKQDSGEKAWWLESNADIPEGIEIRTPSRKGSSESEHSEKYDFYKIRHIDSGEKKDWWKSESDKSKSENKVSNGDDNFTLNVVRIKHIESGEKAWWMASNKNIPEGIKKIEESSEDSDSDSSSQGNDQHHLNGVDCVANGGSGVSRFPLHLPDYEDDEPLGDRKSPEGLETPIVDENFNNRASPYDNVTNKYSMNHTMKPKENIKHVPNFISRHMDIDDILGSSGQIFSPMMNRILARKTGREIVEGDNSECREIDPGQVRIHDSTAQRPVIQRTRSRSDIIDCRDVDQPLQLDDSALQVYKDGDLGPYLDLESSLNEQQEDLEGFHANRRNSIILRTQLSVRVHTIIEKLLNSEGRELRRALFSLKQIFQEDKDLVHEFVQNDGLGCLIRVGADADQNYQNYILRALGQVMLYVDGMNGLMAHNASLQWLYSLVASKFRLVVKTTLKLLLVFVEYVDSNCLLLIEAIEAVDCCQGVPPWTNVMNLLKDYDASDTELLIYTMTLINKCLNGISDRDTYYNQTDWLEEQGMYNIIQRYMARQGTDLDLLRQFQIYEAVLSHEDGDDHGAPLTQLDESIRRTLRSRKSMGGNTCRRSIRHSSNGVVPNGDLCVNGASHYNQAFLQTALSDEQASDDIHAVANSPDQDVFRDSKETRLTKEKRKLRIQRQREFAKEQNDLWSSTRKSDSEKEANEDELTTEGHQLYTSGLQQRIQNGTLGHTGTKDYISDVTSLNNQLNDLYFDKKTPPRTDVKWMKIRNENGDSKYDEENGVEPVTDKKPLLVLSKEQSVKDIAEKLRSPNKTIEEIKFNLAGDLSGLFSKAMEGLKKSKSKGTMKTLEKSEFDATWEKIKKSLKRELIINNLDFTDLCEDSEDSSQPLTDNTNGNPTLSGQSDEINESCRNMLNDNSIDLQAPPPPPFSMPPPPPLTLKKSEDTQVPPPPPNSFNPRSSSVESSVPANKLKTIKLFWREIPTSHLRKTSIGTVWDELSSVNIDKQKLQILFENKTKETMKKQTDQIKSKELVILDQRRSNAINIALKKLPPSQAIKNAIIKMDNSVLIKEMVEKVLSLIPTEEETVKIQEAQIANPSIPLGTAEQFLITLSSITELNSRLKLWVFKLDFELIEADISEKLFDLKQAIHILKNNSTFKNILSVILTIGGFLNGTGSKGFQIDYLSKISEVKDTLNKNSLMYTICEIMEKEHPNSSDLYSEIGAVTRAGKVNVADICTVINKLEEDCKVSTNCYKRIVKHDTSLTKLKLGDFLTDCLERIVILQVVRRRILIRAKTFLQWLGVCDDSDICDNFKIISEFALEYRTTRERVLEQNIRKKAYRERSQTRGKLITENATASEKESLKNILISAPGFSRKRKELLGKGEDNAEQLIEDVFTSLLKKGKKSQHKTSNKKLIKRSRTREGIHEDHQLLP